MGPSSALPAPAAAERSLALAQTYFHARPNRLLIDLNRHGPTPTVAKREGFGAGSCMPPGLD